MSIDGHAMQAPSALRATALIVVGCRTCSVTARTISAGGFLRRAAGSAQSAAWTDQLWAFCAADCGRTLHAQDQSEQNDS